MELINIVLGLLEQTGELPSKYKTHKLSGSYAGFIECHIKGDRLLVWDQNDVAKEIYLTRTGSHSDLFK